MNIQGKIHRISDTQQVKPTFKKREFVVLFVENPQYPQYIKLQCTQDKCGLLDSFKVGDDVSVEFNLRGSEFINTQGQTICNTNLEAWKITKA